MHRPLPIMRRTALGILAGAPLSISARQAAAASSGEGSQAEALIGAEYADAQGALHRLTELTRPLLLVNLWAAWCAGCLSELPTIQQLASRLGPDAIDVRAAQP